MADPFSIIALVATTLKGIVVAKDFVARIAGAPRSVETLADELSTLEGLLREIGHLVKDEDESDMNRILYEPLANCDKIRRQLDRLVGPYVKVSSSGMSTWKRFKFGFKEGEVLQLSADMVSCKQNLQLAIANADLVTTRKVARGMRRVQHRFGIATSSVAGSDIGHIDEDPITRWMTEADTIVEHEEQESNSEHDVEQSIINPLSRSVLNDEEVAAVQLERYPRKYDVSPQEDNTATYAAARSYQQSPESNQTLRIYIKTLTGRSRRYDLKSNDTVQRLKALIEVKEGIAIDQQDLTFEGNTLSNQPSLSHYKVKDGDILHLVLKLQEAPKSDIRIHIKTPAAKTIQLVTRPDQSVLGLKTLIREHEGIPLDMQRLIHVSTGAQLLDDRSLSGHGVQDGDTIAVTLRRL